MHKWVYTALMGPLVQAETNDLFATFRMTAHGKIYPYQQNCWLPPFACDAVGGRTAPWLLSSTGIAAVALIEHLVVHLSMLKFFQRMWRFSSKANNPCK